MNAVQQASTRTQAAPETPALDRVLSHHARTCSFWIFSGSRACSCGVIAARLELAKIRAALGVTVTNKRLGNNGEVSR